MANRIDSLSIELQTNPALKDKLMEQIAGVMENYEKRTIASILKNQDIVGEMVKGGTVTAKKFANATIATYGTARSNRAGDKIKALEVPVKLDDDKEFVEEVEEKDIRFYGVEGIIEKRMQNIDRAMNRYYERKFFNAGVLAGSPFAVSGSDAAAKLESIIQKLETVSNDFVDGVERDQMALVLSPSVYGSVRSYIDNVEKGNVETDIENFGMFHGVLVFSSVYLPATVDYLIMVKGAVAQPVIPNPLAPEKVQLSDATAFGMFLYSGTTAVNSDLIFFAGTLGTLAITSEFEGTSNTSTITVTTAKSDPANDFYYLAHATAVAAPNYGDAVGTTWTKMTLVDGAQDIVFATQTKIRVAEADAAGRIIKVSDETTIVKA